MRVFSPLWRTFIFILIASLFSAIAMIYIEWNNIKNKASIELIYANKIMTSSIQSVFHKNEVLLKIIGQQLVKLGALTHSNSESQKLITNIQKNNPELAGLGLANPSGQLVLTSSNIDRNKLPNLFHAPESSVTFKQALISNSMVIGRTYFMTALGQWIIPMRIRIVNKKGNVVAVMTTGLKLESASNTWSRMHLPQNLRALIIRKDLFPQYDPNIETSEFTARYTQPIKEKRAKEFEKLLEKQTGMNLAQLRTSNVTTSLIAQYGNSNLPILTSISYDPTNKLYTFIMTPMSNLYTKLIGPTIWLVILLAAFILILYWIFQKNIRLQLNSEHTLERQATHDQLTGLPNRRYLLEQFHTWKNNTNRKFSVLFIDLDNFKSSNDLHGHSVGDSILCEVAKRIEHNFQNSLNIRQGGDEFIIFHTETNSEILETLCRKFLNDLTQPIIIDDIIFTIKASIGIAASPHDGTDVDTLLRKSDMAMYEAKRTQIGVYAFSDILEKCQTRKALIETELTHAIEKNEFFLVYQPQVDAETQSIIGVETLLRWENSKLGTVGPDEFIPIAESTGIIINIGLYVINTALMEVNDVYQKFNSVKNIRLSVNVSVRQLLSNNFFEELNKIKSKPEYSWVKLSIEITENLFIEDFTKAKHVLEKIQQSGIGISLDDFGTGFSSLSVLNKLPINEIKIDRSFVNDITSSDQDKQLVGSIINLAKSLNIPVLAEGVETKEQANFLTQNGCDLFQGYYFSKPLTKDKLITYFSTHLEAS